MNPFKLLFQLTQFMSLTSYASCCVCFFSYFFVSSVFAQSSELATKSEKKVGFSITSYNYDEPSYMTLKANKLGINVSATYALQSQWPSQQQGWFVRGMVEALSGKADYQSPFSGDISGTPNRSVEVKALLGKDFEVGQVVLSPYVGLGYRNLYSNIGYDRSSTYNTLPLGLTHKMVTNGNAQLHTTLEYMYFLSGSHKVNLMAQNVVLNQRRGYGISLSVMHQQVTWSMGPTLSYWSMAKSDVSGVLPVYEPQNKTLELGFKGAYHF